ncbi:hypothetical protein J6590_085504, partial [Homalodisca vitripennis]
MDRVMVDHSDIHWVTLWGQSTFVEVYSRVPEPQPDHLVIEYVQTFGVFQLAPAEQSTLVEVYTTVAEAQSDHLVIEYVQTSGDIQLAHLSMTKL